MNDQDCEGIFRLPAEALLDEWLRRAAKDLPGGEGFFPEFEPDPRNIPTAQEIIARADAKRKARYGSA